VTTGAFSRTGLARLAALLSRQVDDGFVPGALAVLAQHGDVHVESVGDLAFHGQGSTTAIAADTICRLGSMSKPIVGACAMTLVDDNTLRLDDPIDDLLPELSNMRVLTDPHGALDDTVAAQRSITIRDVLTYTLGTGTGTVLAEPGTAPNAIYDDSVLHARFRDVNTACHHAVADFDNNAQMYGRVVLGLDPGRLTDSANTLDIVEKEG
jgi:CubicO group peptidase (beta-lactamase class C family)